MDLILNFFSTRVAYADLDTFLVKASNEVVNPLIKLLFALAIAYFLWGVFQFLANQEKQNDEQKQKSDSKGIKHKTSLDDYTEEADTKK